MYIHAMNPRDGRFGIVAELGKNAILVAVVPGLLESNLLELPEVPGKVAGSAVICLYPRHPLMWQNHRLNLQKLASKWRCE